MIIFLCIMILVIILAWNATDIHKREKIHDLEDTILDAEKNYQKLQTRNFDLAKSIDELSKTIDRKDEALSRYAEERLGLGTKIQNLEAKINELENLNWKLESRLNKNEPFSEFEI